MKTKKCPKCGREIPAIAKKCEYCREWQDEDTVKRALAELPQEDKWIKLSDYEIDDNGVRFINVKGNSIKKLLGRNSSSITVNNGKVDAESQISDETYGTENVENFFENNKNIIIGIVVIIVFAIITMLTFKGCKSTPGSNSDSLLLDTALTDNVGTDDQIIVDFITDMYNNFKYTEKEFLKKHCTSSLFSKLEADLGTEFSLFRTSAPEYDMKYATRVEGENRSEIISVVPEGNGWYTYEFYDTGYNGKNRIKAFVKDGVVMMDDVERLFDEYAEYKKDQENLDADEGLDEGISNTYENEMNETNVKSAETVEESKAHESYGNKVFDAVDQMPSFPGGNGALVQYLSRNVNYPKVAQENGVQGRVVVSFVVESNGSITDVKVAKSVEPSLDKEAARVVRAMPKWIPGKQKGTEVRVRYNIPISFRLN